MMNRTTHSIATSDDHEATRLDPSLSDQEGLVISSHHCSITDSSASLSPSLSCIMNRGKQRQHHPVTVQRRKDEEVLFWQRKTTSMPRSSCIDVSTTSHVKSQSSTPVVIKAISRRKKSSSTSSKMASKKRSDCMKRAKVSSFLDSDASLGDFSNKDEIAWQPKKEECRDKETDASSCNLNDMDGRNGRRYNPHINNSISSISLNSDCGGSFESSESSMSNDKLPLSKTPRRHHAARTVELRKQMRELHRVEHLVIPSDTLPKKHSSAPRIFEATAARDTVRHHSMKLASTSHVLAGLAASPIKRTRSLQRKESLEPEAKDSHGQTLDSDEAPHSHPKPLRGSSSRGPAIRNILRNRRKLERNLKQSNVLHYVLYNGSPLTNMHPQRQDSAWSMGSCPNNFSTVHMPITHVNGIPQCLRTASLEYNPSSSSTCKMPLDQFLKMKDESELLAQIQRHHDKELKPSPKVVKRKGLPISRHTPQQVEETWHESHSLDNFLSNHGSLSNDIGPTNSGGPFTRVRPVLGQSMFRLNQQSEKEQNQGLKQQDDSVIDDEGCIDIRLVTSPRARNDEDNDEQNHDSLDSFISSDWKDLPSAWKNDMEDLEEENEANSPVFHESKRSIGLSLLMDDARMFEEDDLTTGDDIVSLQNSTTDLSLDRDFSIGVGGATKVQVRDLIMTDNHSGRRSVYSGPISTFTGLPHGTGQLEFPDFDESFTGCFFHGWSTGYGACINRRTKEEHIGYFLDYVKHGHGVTKYSDGRVFDGFYNKGILAEGKLTYLDGSSYIGSFENDARNGRGTYTFPNGVVFFGKFRDDQFLSGVLLYPNGSRFVGHWRNGVRHGPGKELRSDGSLIRDGIWREGCYDV
jgi:hypothetical protein